MSNEKECAQYFRNQSAYHRCFQELWKKWRSYGRIAGRITLKNTSEAERRAIGGMIGKTFYEETIRFSFSEFEEGLQKTRFGPVDMQILLEGYFGKKLRTHQSEMEEEQKRKSDFFGELVSYVSSAAGEDTASSKWMKDVTIAKKYGYQLIIKEYGKNPGQAKKLVRNVGQALIRLEELHDLETDVPLAVFAADITDNPHYFDRGTIPGQLLVHGICYCKGAELPESAHGWRRLMQSVHIIPDNISSFVHAYGLRLLTNEGWHPAYELFCSRKEPYVITMENLCGIVGALPAGTQADMFSGGSVYVVENEMVFTYLIHNLGNRQYTLLCTSGQPRSAVQLLLPMILKSGAQIYYSGDIDPDGIRIADRLWQKFGDGFHIWRMEAEDYEKSCSNEVIGTVGIRKLENIHHPQLKLTAEAVKKKEKAGYQENILQELLNDIVSETERKSPASKRENDLSQK